MPTLPTVGVSRARSVWSWLVAWARFEKTAATALEFALILPVLMYLILASIDVGMMMFASEEVNAAAAAALRQVRTGALQQAASTSAYAGQANCASANFVLTSSQNCLGPGVTGSPTQMFAQLMCNNMLGDTAVDCTKMAFNVVGYTANWTSFTGTVPTLSYGSSPTQTLTNIWTTAGSQVIAASVGYNYQFFTPFLGCLFDMTDCSAGNPPTVPLTYYTLFQAEPWS